MSDRTDTERLDWLAANADMILSRNHFTQDEYHTPATLWCNEDESLREAIDAWMALPVPTPNGVA